MVNLWPSNFFPYPLLQSPCPKPTAAAAPHYGTMAQAPPAPQRTTGSASPHTTSKDCGNGPRSVPPGRVAPPLSSRTSPRVKAPHQQPSRPQGGGVARPGEPPRPSHPPSQAPSHRPHPYRRVPFSSRLSAAIPPPPQRVERLRWRLPLPARNDSLFPECTALCTLHASQGAEGGRAPRAGAAHARRRGGRGKGARGKSSPASCSCACVLLGEPARLPFLSVWAVAVWCYCVVGWCEGAALSCFPCCRKNCREGRSFLPSQ